jgi:NADPH2:quinone reductase
MRAVQVSRLNGPGALEEVDIAEPEAGPDQVLIDVEAAGVAWPDLLQTRGLYQIRPEPPFVSGSEVAGRIRWAPEGSGFVPGQRVAALTGGHAWQETTTAPVGQTFAIPDGLSSPAAAGVLLNYLTMHFAFRKRTVLQPGEVVLVHGASGGIGEASLILARAWGARTIAVVSTEAALASARRVGADEVIRAEGFKDAARQLTDGRGVDVVVDPVGGDRFTDSLRSLAGEGRLLVIGFTGGEIPTVKVNRLLLNNVSVTGVAWGEYVWRTPGYVAEQWAELEPLIASGSVVIPEAATYPLAQARDVLAAMEARTLIGKAVLVP